MKLAMTASAFQIKYGISKLLIRFFPFLVTHWKLNSPSLRFLKNRYPLKVKNQQVAMENMWPEIISDTKW